MLAIEVVGKCQAHRQIVRVGETVGPRWTSRLKPNTYRVCICDTAEQH